MNIPQSKLDSNRMGITIIEVLTAIVVAMIGVFGVMILIPFGIQQAQLGIDRDEAATAGRNAFDFFEIRGFQRVFDDENRSTRWLSVDVDNLADPPQVVIHDRSVPDPPSPQPAIPRTAQVWAIDPLGVTEGGLAAIDGFPWIDSGSTAPTVVKFKRVNLLDTNSDAFTLAMARKMFRSTDDVQFANVVDDLGPPQQVYDKDSFGVLMRRQSRGEMSWNAIAVPVKDDITAATGDTIWGWKFDLHVLVHKSRNFDKNTQYQCRLLYPNTDPSTDLNPRTAFGGGTLTMDVGLGFTDARKDDWVMLVNQRLDGDSGFRDQIAFYRVIGIADNVGAVPARGASITLVGPDFELGETGVTHTETYAIHLVGMVDDKVRTPYRSGRVVNVFGRTIRWESDSNWN